jgi:hypothetical protein
MNFIMLRYIGSISALIGYLFLLNIDMQTGIIIRIFGNLLPIPWAIKYKVWDFLVLIVFFLAVEIHKLIALTSK